VLKKAKRFRCRFERAIEKTTTGKTIIFESTIGSSRGREKTPTSNRGRCPQEEGGDDEYILPKKRQKESEKKNEEKGFGLLIEKELARKASSS